MNSEKAAFLFPGQGSQYVGMGRDFYERSEEAKRIFDTADEVLGYKLSSLMFEGPEEELKLTQNTQPAILTVSFAAFTLLGVKPVLAAGHSLGEYSAVTAAGTIKFEDALVIVHKRGRYMQEAVPVGKGAMAAVIGVSGEEIARSLSSVSRGLVEIANWNSDDQLVISGEKEAVEEALEKIKPPRFVMLPVSAPFHSILMKPTEEKLAADMEAVAFNDPDFPIITNVDARLARTAEEIKKALKLQISHAVLWKTSMDKLKTMDMGVCVELGPSKVLLGLMKKIMRGWPKQPALLNVENMDDLKRAAASLSTLTG